MILNQNRNVADAKERARRQGRCREKLADHILRGSACRADAKQTPAK
jgi:hypothetical protein